MTYCILVYVATFCSFPLLHDSPGLTMQGQGKSPTWHGGGVDDGSKTSTQDWGRRWSPLRPAITWLWNCSPLSSWSSTLLPACEPHHRPTLTEPFLAFPSAPWWVLSVLREKNLCWAKSWDMFCCFSMRKAALCWALLVWHVPFTHWQELVKWPNVGARGPGKCTLWMGLPSALY